MAWSVGLVLDTGYTVTVLEYHRGTKIPLLDWLANGYLETARITEASLIADPEQP
jgi:hypothetical protein